MFDSDKIKLDYQYGLFTSKGLEITFAVLDVEVDGLAETYFPRNGFSILNFFTQNYAIEFQNYQGSRTIPYRFYLAGLFTNVALKVAHTGKGKGYAFKIHPVIAHHMLKTSMKNLVNKQVLLSKWLTDSKILGQFENNGTLRYHEVGRMSILFDILLPPKEVYQNDPMYHIVNFIASKKGKVTINDITSKFHITERTLHRNFTYKVGISFKSYAKIWQFENALKLMQVNPEESLSSIAYKSGYYDMAHLAKDFQNYMDCAPKSLRHETSPMLKSYLDTQAIT
ncbi:helix-turn-helix transcriptional regulator [Pareuzebyella sediminis]|uniref:helix-turn-helix transcriptional regulator n=1 Tax=Pareuzebyella sediminis TaxID=2607998 RepID=UPI0011EFB6D2|nr:helix-turn-helix transcriptional regulator [Pareuzebyella sediminis]